MSKTMLLIPFYNEEQRIDTDAIREAVHQHRDLHLLLIDDGSTDATAGMLEEIAATEDRIEVYRSSQNLGKGKVIRQAVLDSEAALNTYDYIGYFDGDLSAPLGFYRRLRGELEVNPESIMAMGSRQPTTTNDLKVRPYRRAIGRFVAQRINKIVGYPFYDTQCGAKLFRDDSLIQLLREPLISSWLFDVEILCRLRDSDYGDLSETVLEIPIDSWVHRDGSKISASYFPQMMREMSKISKRYNS